MYQNWVMVDAGCLDQKSSLVELLLKFNVFLFRISATDFKWSRYFLCNVDKRPVSGRRTCAESQVR